MEAAEDGGMDHAWRLEWMREWVELGEREGLTYKEVGLRAGVCARTVRRWKDRLVKEHGRKPFKLDEERARRGQEPREVTQAKEADVPEEAFVQLVEPARSAPGRIEIVLPGDRRVVIDGSVDVESLARVIAAVDQC